MRLRIAERLGLGVEDAAVGFHWVVNAPMVAGVRLASVGQGLDSRGLDLVVLWIGRSVKRALRPWMGHIEPIRYARFMTEAATSP